MQGVSPHIHPHQWFPNHAQGHGSKLMRCFGWKEKIAFSGYNSCSQCTHSSSRLFLLITLTGLCSASKTSRASLTRSDGRTKEMCMCTKDKNFSGIPLSAPFKSAACLLQPVSILTNQQWRRKLLESSHTEQAHPWHRVKQLVVGCLFTLPPVTVLVSIGLVFFLRLCWAEPRECLRTNSGSLPGGLKVVAAVLTNPLTCQANGWLPLVKHYLLILRLRKFKKEQSPQVVTPSLQKARSHDFLFKYKTTWFLNRSCLC